MTTYFISRHPGAIEWAARQGLAADLFLPHLDPMLVQKGDAVFGSLPVNLAAQVGERGAAYWHLSLEVPAGLRGHELDADDMERLGARIEPFDIKLVSQPVSQMRLTQAAKSPSVPSDESQVDQLIASRYADAATKIQE